MGFIGHRQGSAPSPQGSRGRQSPVFYTKLYVRILRPNWPALLPEADPFPRALRAALDVLDREIQKLHEEATLAA